MLSLRRWPEAAITLVRTFGAEGLLLRATHELRRTLGAFRRRPRYELRSFTTPRQHPFAVQRTALEQATNRAVAIERAERVLAGEYQAYRNEWRALPTRPEEWHRAPPPAGTPLPAAAPWWRASHHTAAGIDIKSVWEPARFAWVYDLVRAYLLTRDDRYAQGFHRLFGAWCDGNPPFRGVHWSCGQEAAIRAIALLYAEANLAGAPSSDAWAMQRLARVLAASGERIADAVGQAIAQRNNHGISEAVGLLVLGARFRGVHRDALTWASQGRRLLERLVREQFAEDGWYIQHSFNYLRLALEQCIIAQRVLRSASISLSPPAVARLKAAVRLLLTVIDPETGTVPNHGHNDGSFIHPATLAPYRDYRPVITAACAMFGIPLPSNVPPDREVLAWLGVPEPARGGPLGDGVWSGGSGWAASRLGSTAVFLRAGRYTSRPGHLDPLHLDVRLGGREVIVDPGTFSYNAPPPWRNALADAVVHNGPIVDGEEPGVRGPRFLWLIWPHATLLRADWEAHESADRREAVVLAAEIPGRVRRTVRVTRSAVSVTDEVLARDAHRVVVRWLLHPDAPTHWVRVDGNSRVIEAAEGDPRGWFSPCYEQRIPSRVIEVERDARLGHHITCTFSISDTGPPDEAAPPTT